MKSKFFFLLFVSVGLLSYNVHKYYLSLTQIKFKEEQKSVQIIINVFMDDIELALNKDYNIDLQLTTKTELKDNNVYFEKYLKDKLQFKINGEFQVYNYLGKEYDGDLVFFYLEIENIASITTIEVANNILTFHFPTQQNLIKSKVGEKNKSVLLTKENANSVLNFN